MVSILDTIHEMSPSERQACGWVERSLGSDEVLFHQGSPADSLYVVDTGKLAVIVDGVTLDSVGPDDTLGESSVFMVGQRRLASAVAREDCVVWGLDRDHVRTLMRDEGPLFDLLLERALQDTWQRLLRTDRDIIAIAGTRLRPTASTPGMIARTLARWGRSTGAPDAYEALARVPVVGWSSVKAREEIAWVAEPVHVAPGEALFEQGGHEDDAIFVVASGSIGIHRTHADGVPREVVVLQRGSMFGAAAFVANEPRSAAAVGKEDSWVFGIRRSDVQALDTEARRTFLTTVLSTMRQQQQAAVEQMTAVADPTTDVEGLLTALGHVEGWRADDPRTAVPSGSGETASAND